MNGESSRQNLIQSKRSSRRGCFQDITFIEYLEKQPLISHEWVLCDIIYYDYNFRKVWRSLTMHTLTPKLICESLKGGGEQVVPGKYGLAGYSW